MSETESPIDSVDVAVAAAADADAVSTIDLANRPSIDWLDQVEAEVDDVDLVLKCLARESASICQTCATLDSTGQLDQRPVLARCARAKKSDDG